MPDAEFLGKAGPLRHSRVPHDLSAAGLITPSKAWEKSMRVSVLGATALVACGVAITIAIVQCVSSTSAQNQNRVRDLPEYTASGDLILPKDFHEWVYVGSPLTPNALNDGMANFPEFHNVYIEPGSYEIYKQTNQFPEGTIMFKELQ
jgi:hypothetical protein